MAKLTLQEQLLKAGLVTSKKAAKVENGKKSRVQAREARAAVEENKRHSRRDKQQRATKQSGVGERI